LPGVRVGDKEPPPERVGKFPKGYRVHNTNVYPQRPDRAYLGVVDGGVVILDISDKSKPKMISRWDNSPPYAGFTHTVVPLFDRGLLISTDESIAEGGADWPKLIWILDARAEENLVPIATCPAPPMELMHAGGRFGAHNIHENVPRDTAWQSDQFVLGTFSGAGLRAYDISSAYEPREVGFFMPSPPAGSPKGTTQLNDVHVDENGIVYTMDRYAGGLYILEMDF
jgi:hypothetical protein